MAYVAINIEGGLVSGDLLERIATTPDQVEGQRPADFGVEGRLSEEIQSAFSEAATHWRALQARLNRGKESVTTITRETWMLPLLQELNYELHFQRAGLKAGGNTYSISHLLGDDANAPPVHIIGSDQELDKRGEAKQSPHALVQDYLNKSDALWGILTNGKRLRLLRDTARFSKPTYIEFDLEGMMEGGLYSEFVLFYRLVHVSRMPRDVGEAHDCLLERYHQQGIEEGGRVREKLRDGVKEALEILGTGLLSHPASAAFRGKFAAKRVDELNYYRQLLRLIYRLLFLMVAEERRLLFVASREEAARQAIYTQWYSMARLRDRAGARFFDDGESDLWEGLKQTFRLFEDEKTASQLGLTALDGELFGRVACADLIDTKDVAGPRLLNADLLSAIWHLSTFEDSDGKKGRRGPRRRVNFAGLDVEELGSVYEALLDYHPQVSGEGERSKFELVAGSERKSTGSYYTPPALVHALIKSALEPVIADRVARAGTKEEKERALLSLKICDPASGSGHFVLAAARRIGRELARVRSGETEPNPEEYRRAVRDVIRRCVYAVDKNPLAVDLCKVALWIEGHASGLPLSFLDNHVKCGDSLVGVLDLSVIEAGVPDGAYTAVTGDDKRVASAVKKDNKAEVTGASLFLHNVKGDIGKIAGAFAAVAELPETTPDDVHAKESRYANLRRGSEWERVKSACDVWTAAFFAPLSESEKLAIPTTRDVWDAVAGRFTQGRVAGLTNMLVDEQRFFHWPLEFPEVFAQGGFDVMLGNPPWGRIKLQEREFFATRDRTIANAPNKAARERLIETLYAPDASPDRRALGEEWRRAKQISDYEGKFLRESGRYPLTATGDINTYAIFAENFLRESRADGRAGFIVPTGIVTDFSYRAFFNELVEHSKLVSVIGFDNQRRIFPAVHPDTPFALVTIGTSRSEPEFAFYLLDFEHLSDRRRFFTLSKKDISLISPNTRTAGIFRSQSDAELTKKICKNAPILISEEGNSDWGAFYIRLIHYGDHSRALRFESQLQREGFQSHGRCFEKNGKVFLPVYEGKMIYQYDCRFATYVDAKKTKELTDRQKDDPLVAIIPKYWVSEDLFNEIIRKYRYTVEWFIAYRDVTNATNARTAIACALPRLPASVKLPIIGFNDQLPGELILANFNSLLIDFIARTKVGGTSLAFSIAAQLPVLSHAQYGESGLIFVRSRVLELTYTTEDMRAFAKSLGYDGPPFRWDRERRALLRAELDAYYAYLYGLTKTELEYILDPKAVMGEDYPSETFRVLKENEIKEFGEYRTQRLVLETWDRCMEDGTFDHSRLGKPGYIDRLAEELANTRAKRAEMERNQLTLLAFASQTPKPTLFVEGTTDVAIIEAAWSTFFPTEPIPVKVLPAGGTKEMGSLAGKGKALREILGDRIVLALADNDAAGRAITGDGQINKGGAWKQLPNGIHWCLLNPTAHFAAAMKAFEIPAGYWPFTIEAAFPPSLRRRAEAAGAYKFSGKPLAEFFDNPEVGRRLAELLPKLSPNDDAYWYLMAPSVEAKEAFAAWVTRPEQRIEANYAAFEVIVRGLRDLLNARLAGEERGRPRAA